MTRAAGKELEGSMRGDKPKYSEEEKDVLREVRDAVLTCLQDGGYSARALARTLGVTAPAIYGWRDGIRMPGLYLGTKLLALAERVRRSEKTGC
jgi:transposase-like protein